MKQAREQGFWRRTVHAGCRAVGRLRRGTDGSAAVEFAIVATPFFAILFAIIETGLCLWAGQVLDTATSEASRLIMTGQAEGMTREEFKTRLCSNIVGLIDCSAVLIDVNTYQTWADVDVLPPIDDGKTTASGTSFAPGVAGSIVVVRAVYEYPLLVRTFGLDLADLDNGRRLLVATVAFQNEPYTVSFLGSAP